MRAKAKATLLFSLPLAAALVWACTPEQNSFDTVCAEAAHKFSSCGATLPALEDSACGATERAVAMCVINNAPTCEALAALYQRIDVCVAGFLDNDGGIPEVEEVPRINDKPKDAGVDARRPSPQKEDASVVIPGDDAGFLIDAGSDAGTTDGPWEGFTVDGILPSGASRSWVTPMLEPGTYRFALSGTGDADLYVRVGAAASVSLWDCRPFLNGSTESCPITLTTSAKVHLMVRGIAATSNFMLEGSP